MGERRGTKALELWCRRMTEGYPGVKIDNMTTSWRDGLAFCAMIHHFRPDLIEFDKLNKSDVYYNNELAFTTAEKYLGIPALLDADDMAAYEVPDRLSILTYLSQFYQVFAAQDAHNRLKRPSPATAEKSISKTPGPPPKMAHVVGVPKRDPCRKCQLPVFLAERLTVGKNIYHRTCLKCARCGYQLTPGSFYETEVDDEYCCETCPDEEADSEMVLGASNSAVLMRSPTAAPAAAASPRQSPSHEDRRSPVGMLPHSAAKTVRSSIADRLAFFEKTRPNGDSEAVDASAFAAGSHKLSESVTDEEKTQSLQRIGGGGESPAAKQYKMNAALSNFLSDTVGSEPSSMADKTEDSLSTDNDDDDEEGEESEDVEMRQSEADKPPELPKSLPPAASPSPNKRFTTTAQLQMFSPQPTATDAIDSAESGDQPQPASPEGRNKTEIALVLSSVNNNDELLGDTQAERVTEPHEHESEAIPQQPQPEDRQDKDLELSENRNCVTKEKSDATIDTTLRAASSNSEERHEHGGGGADEEVQLREKPVERMDEDVETTERLSVVRARLQQFEVIANATNNNNQQHPNDPSDNTASPASSPQKKSQDLPQEVAEVSAKEQDVVVEEVKEDAEKEMDELAVKEVEEESVKDVGEASMKGEEKVPAKEVDKVEPQETPEVVKQVSEKVKEKVLDPEPLAVSPKEEEPKQQQEEVGVSPQADVTESPKEEPMQIEADDSKLHEDEPKVAATTPTKDGEGDGVKPLAENASPIAAVTPKVLPRPSLAKQEKEIAIPGSSNTSSTTTLRAYPEDLNPFKSDDDEDDAAVSENKENHVAPVSVVPKKTAASANPFDSSDDEIELEKVAMRSSSGTPSSQTKIPPPRPPPPRISRNPFGEEDEGPTAMSRGSSLNSSINRRTPVPTPRTNLSQNPTPEPTPRLSAKSPASVGVLQNSSDYYGSVNSLSSSTAGTPLHRNSELRGSANSLASSAGGTVRMRKNRKAPAPPPPVKELFPSTAAADTVNSSRASTPSSSTVGTPKSARKKRLAPAPPKPARLSDSGMAAPQIVVVNSSSTESPPKNLLSYPLQSDLDSKLSDEEKALLEGKHAAALAADPLDADGRRSSRRLIPLDDSLLADMKRERSEEEGERVGGHGDDSQCDDLKEEQQQHKQQDHLRQNFSGYSYAGDSEEAVVYRRVLVPPTINTPTHESNPLLDELNAAHRDRQLEKLKDNKEANNRNRQSQISAASSGTDEGDSVTALYNKSSHGKWKRRKGPAPALPVPPRKVLQMLPLQEIRHELGIIEVQQQGLEKQGVILEKMIRDRCENERGEPLTVVGPGPDGPHDGADDAASSLAQNNQNSKEVEDLILQLFELVNEKNELFRRQAELMYLRRQHRLEQEQADLEYEIRVLMAQPERNKTDSDKAREEALIARLVEVVQLRNEVVECLEMDRLREAEEDLSIKQRLELHTSKRDDSDDGHKVAANAKLSKKEKRKQKESKKLSKNKKIDADKDADETELDTDKQKLKKKKKKFLF